MNYFPPCLQMKVHVYCRASSGFGGRQEVEEGRNFRKVKALWGSGLTDEWEDKAICRETGSIEMSK